MGASTSPSKTPFGSVPYRRRGLESHRPITSSVGDCGPYARRFVALTASSVCLRLRNSLSLRPVMTSCDYWR